MYPNLFRNEGTDMKFVSFYVWLNFMNKQWNS